MKAEIRETLGKAAYEAVLPLDDLNVISRLRIWEKADPYAQEFYRIEAEAVVKKLAEILVPILQLMLSDDDVKHLLEQLRGAE